MPKKILAWGCKTESEFCYSWMEITDLLFSSSCETHHPSFLVYPHRQGTQILFNCRLSAPLLSTLTCLLLCSWGPTCRKPNSSLTKTSGVTLTPGGLLDSLCPRLPSDITPAGLQHTQESLVPLPRVPRPLRYLCFLQSWGGAHSRYALGEPGAVHGWWLPTPRPNCQRSFWSLAWEPGGKPGPGTAQGWPCLAWRPTGDGCQRSCMSHHCQRSCMSHHRACPSADSPQRDSWWGGDMPH